MIRNHYDAQQTEIDADELRERASRLALAYDRQDELKATLARLQREIRITKQKLKEQAWDIASQLRAIVEKGKSRAH